MDNEQKKVEVKKPTSSRTSFPASPKKPASGSGSGQDGKERSLDGDILWRKRLERLKGLPSFETEHEKDGPEFGA